MSFFSSSNSFSHATSNPTSASSDGRDERDFVPRHELDAGALVHVIHVHRQHDRSEDVFEFGIPAELRERGTKRKMREKSEPPQSRRGERLSENGK